MHLNQTIRRRWLNFFLKTCSKIIFALASKHLKTENLRNKILLLSVSAVFSPESSDLFDDRMIEYSGIRLHTNSVKRKFRFFRNKFMILVGSVLHLILLFLFRIQEIRLRWSKFVGPLRFRCNRIPLYLPKNIRL